MDQRRINVHKSHCCILHGCKYGDRDCPVINREVEQQYLCEDCSIERIDTFEDLHKTIKERESI